MLLVALVINILIVVLELAALGSLRKKLDILRYYTYLQNLLALLVSIGFCVCLAAKLAFDRPVPEFCRGLRYAVTCGLCATAFIYFIFLAGNEKNLLSEQDFVKGFSPKLGNFILHLLCPLLSLLSFVTAERALPLENPVWTGLAAIPSCLYWLVYLQLSAAKLWEEPYDFSHPKAKGGKLLEALTLIALPLSFILISMLVWNIK